MVVVQPYLEVSSKNFVIRGFQETIKHLQVEDEFEKENKGCVQPHDPPEFFLGSSFFNHGVPENHEWIGQTDDSSILIHAHYHGEVNEVLCLRNNNVEECLNVSHYHWHWASEGPDFLHLLELDLFVNTCHLEKRIVWFVLIFLH